MNPSLAFLKSFSDISQESVAKLVKIASLKKIKANTQIAKTGEVPYKMYMLVSGMIRVYMTTEDGKEYNKNFFLPMSFVGSFTALVNKEPSELTYETLTDCEVYSINFEDFVDLYSKDLEFCKIYIKILEYVFIKYEARQLELISMDATQRYLQLREQIPDIDSLIQQYHIASYLSITPVQLSRIRKNLKL